MSKYLAAIHRKDSFLGLYNYESVTKPPNTEDRHQFTVIGNDVLERSIFKLENINRFQAFLFPFLISVRVDYEYPKTDCICTSRDDSVAIPSDIPAIVGGELCTNCTSAFF